LSTVRGCLSLPFTSVVSLSVSPSAAGMLVTRRQCGLLGQPVGMHGCTQAVFFRGDNSCQDKSDILKFTLCVL
jgi:hypothetical protein